MPMPAFSAALISAVSFLTSALVLKSSLLAVFLSGPAIASLILSITVMLKSNILFNAGSRTFPMFLASISMLSINVLNLPAKVLDCAIAPLAYLPPFSVSLLIATSTASAPIRPFSNAFRNSSPDNPYIFCSSPCNATPRSWNCNSSSPCSLPLACTWP